MDESPFVPEPFTLPGTSLLAVVRTMLDGYDYRHELLGDNAVRFSIRMSRGIVFVLFWVSEELRTVTVTGMMGVYMPVDRRAVAAELASRINYGLFTGSFEVDFSDGEVRYRIGHGVGDDDFSAGAADRMLGYTLSAVNGHLEAFMNVGFSGMEAEAALVMVGG